MKKTNNRGITLVALIITIVVLLILAVVAIGQAQDSNIVGYAQNAASKYTEAEANEVSLLTTYETQLEAITAEKIVLGPQSGEGKLTILPSSGTIIFENYDGGERYTLIGTFTVEPITQNLINDLAENGMPTNASDYMTSLNLRISADGDVGEAILLVTNNEEFYLEGEKLRVISLNVSDDTVEDAIDKYTNTIANTIENTVENNEIAN